MDEFSGCRKGKGELLPRYDHGEPLLHQDVGYRPSQTPIAVQESTYSRAVLDSSIVYSTRYLKSNVAVKSADPGIGPDRAVCNIPHMESAEHPSKTVTTFAIRRTT